ncbi:hypothetical protein R2103_00455 [Nitrosomonas sp. Is24]|uniref:RipA family octameric membrane protein n=1 Tax=Nitrosomonas sp. Is24 TaxID=3080533 RepID=UPI00294B18F0|nr:hypothetical protein [Nitrosomonas sp. Is24]MDV6340241.1 hypothetical protein [Nitrosomonas sp. Is24]
MINIFNGSNKQKLMQSEIAVQRYASVNAYMAYEGQIYWTRAQFFLAANALLIGFALPILPTLIDKQTLYRIIIVSGASLAGLILTWLWQRSLKAGEYWLNHWRSELRKLEEDAYGDLLLHREFPPESGRVSATKIAHHTTWLFYGVWGLVIIYLSYFAFKLSQKIC